MEPSIHHFRRGHKQTAQIEQTVDVVEFQFIKYFLFIRVEGITKELPQKPFSWPRNNRLTFSKNGLYSSIYNNDFVAFLARMTRKNLMAHPHRDIEITCKLSFRAYLHCICIIKCCTADELYSTTHVHFSKAQPYSESA